MKPYRCLLFDLDRTLWDVEKNQKEALRLLYGKFRLDRFDPDFEHCFGLYAAHNDRLWIDYRDGKVSREELRNGRFRLMFRDMGVEDEALALALGNEYVKLAPTFRHVIPGAPEVTAALAARYPLYIVTNGFAEVQHIKLEHCGMAHAFRAIVCSEEAGANKPDPRIFRHTLSLAGVAPSQALMIGDDPETDIRGAVAAGIDTVHFDPSSAPWPYEFVPTYRIGSLAELLPLLLE